MILSVNHPILSVITINFNNLEGLNKTFESVFVQTDKNFEYIVIDGGSTDGSTEYIEQNTSKINYWVSEKDSGVYNAMNKGIKVSSGEYLLFLNSGDTLFESNTLEKVLVELKNTSVDFLYGDAVFVKNNKNEKVVFPNELSFLFFYKSSLCHQSTFIKSSLLKENLYNENFKIVSDWEFNLLQIIQNNKTYKHLNLLICYYDLNGISATQKTKDKQERLMVFNRYFSGFLKDYEIYDNLSEKRIKELEKSLKSKLGVRMIKWAIDLTKWFTRIK